MAYRVMDAGDVSSLGFGQVGDVVVDAPTSVHADGKLLFEVQNGSTTFAGHRLGFRVWVDGNLGTWYQWRLRGNLSGDMAEWEGASDANNYVEILPFPGTQIRCERNASTNSGFLFLVSNIKFFRLYGENDVYPGLRDGWPGVFLTKKFGFYCTNGVWPPGGHVFSLSTPAGGHCELIGIEAQGGFSAIRFSGGDYDATVKITIRRSYLHDAGDGEGFYLGATHAYPYVLLRCEIDDCVIARRACEGIQIQHIVSNIGENNTVKRFVNYAPAMDGLKAFQGGQDTAIQWSQAGGGNIIRDGITDGSAFTSVALNHFGTTDYPGLTVDSTIPSIAENLCFTRIGGILSYIHNSNIDGNWKMMRNIFLVGFTNRYYYDNLNTLADYYVSANNGTNRLSWIDIVHDGVKNNMFQNTANHEIINIQQNNSLTPPQYINSGFYEPASDLMNWKATYGNYHDDNTLDKPVTYQEGWIVVNIEDGVEYAMYRVMSTHTTTGLAALNPRQDVAANGEVRYKKLTWDTQGRRNILGNGLTNPAWNGSSEQSLIPPDDLRLVADTYWNRRGMGLSANPHNTDYTQYQWFRNNSASPTGAIAIPWGKEKNYTPERADLGKYLALGIKRKDANGNWDETWQYSNWSLVS